MYDDKQSELYRSATGNDNHTVIALAGNPNCGKTTLFNFLTGSRQRTGNWAGVTVEKKAGDYQYESVSFNVVDLPGSYSLDVGIGDISLDEKIARDYILSRKARLIINVIDASNLERNLYLTVQLMEMKCPMVVVLNMMDVAKSRGMDIDIEGLSRRLGCPVIPFVASGHSSGKMEQLKKTVYGITTKEPEPPLSFSFGKEVEKQIATLMPVLEKIKRPAGMTTRWMAIKLLEGDVTLDALLGGKELDLVSASRRELERARGEDADIVIAEKRYTRISQLTGETVRRKQNLSRTLTSKIDSIVLSPVFGIPVFLLVMYCMFTFAIKTGQIFQDVFQQLFEVAFVSGAGHLMAWLHAPGWLTAMVTGAGQGMATVANFVPLIASLFLFLSFLEDTGYMVRAAFVVDRLMKKIGLPGNSFVPLIVGFGCNVPAIMSTRSLQRERDRKLSIMMNPFMSCGARLQVFALLTMVFFPSGGQNVVFFLYLLGIAVAVFTGLVMKTTLLPGPVSPFVLEMPVYHLPTVRVTIMRTWDRLKGFIVRAGKIIVLLVMVITALHTLGRDGTVGNDDTDNSVLATVSRTITPVFRPMGITEDNWPATIGIFTGVLAKETVAGTLNAVYGQIGAKQKSVIADKDTREDFNLWEGFRNALATVPANFHFWLSSFANPFTSGNIDRVSGSTRDVMHQLFGSTFAVIAYMIFVLLYFPCVATLGAIRREAGVNWMLFSASWTTYLAYTFSVVFYQSATFFQHPGYSTLWIVTLLSGVAAIIYILRHLGYRMDRQQNDPSHAKGGFYAR